MISPRNLKILNISKEVYMIVALYTMLIILVSSLVVLNVYKIHLYSQVRKQGKLKIKGRITMFDVRHLLMQGEKELAIQLYGELFHVTFTKAKKDVEELQRSLKV